MTKAEFIEYLEGYDDNQELYVVHTAGDYWKSQLASPIESMEEGYIKHSDYHRQAVVDNEDDRNESDENQDTVILITIGQRY
jgi:hypothetical protein